MFIGGGTTSGHYFPGRNCDKSLHPRRRNEMDKPLSNILKNYNLMIGERTAEEIRSGDRDRLRDEENPKTMEIRGRDLVAVAKNTKSVMRKLKWRGRSGGRYPGGH